jgi:hypothetical protein
MHMKAKITKSEAARRLRVTNSAITSYLKRGMPVNRDGLLDWAHVKRWHSNNIIRAQKLRGRRPIAKDRHASNGTGDLASLANTRIERERVRLKREQLELDEATGKLVDREDVSARYNARVIQVRNSLRRVPAILAQSIAIETDPARCQKLVAAAIDAALEEMADEAQN